jgi:hypothetical protein
VIQANLLEALGSIPSTTKQNKKTLTTVSPEAEAREREFESSLDYIARPFLKKKRKEKKRKPPD